MDANLLEIPNTIKYFQQIEFPYKYGLMEKFFGDQLSKKGICWVKSPLGLPWKLDMSMVTHRWIVYGSYDSSFLKWAKKNVTNDGVIVDSGANIGQMTLYFGEWCKQGKVLAFEPSKEAANWLIECISKNSSSNIELIQKGLGKQASAAVLIDKGKERNENIHAFWSYISDQEGVQGETITLTSLDEELNKRNIKEVDLWKLDVEGFELPALEGAKTFLESHNIKAIYAELTTKEDNHIKIIDYLTKYGYECHYFDWVGKLYKPKEMRTFHTNGLFLPKTSH